MYQRFRHFEYVISSTLSSVLPNASIKINYLCSGKS